MAILKWLHISDLHLNKTGVETTRLREQLPKYLREQKIECDYVFCTGDIRYAPTGDFPCNSLEVIKDICDAVGVSASHLFIVPGNHDVNRDLEERTCAIKNTWLNGSGYYDSKEGIINDGDLENIMSGLQEFEKNIEKPLEEEYRNTNIKILNFGQHQLVETEDFNIVKLNSVMTYSQGQERDFIVGTYNLQQALIACNDNKIKVVLTHYSFDYLTRQEQEEVLALFRDYNIRLWFAGHEHNNIVRKQRDYFYEFQCGNLMLEADTKTCVLVGEIDTETLTGKLVAHAWFSPNGWVTYPFISQSDLMSPIYSFSLVSGVQGNLSILAMERKKLRKKILMLLDENGQIFNTFGPTLTNSQDIHSEKEKIWEQLIQSKIIPNSLAVIEVLKQHHHLLKDSEIGILNKYEVHVYSFRLNHNGNKLFKLDAPRFPVEIMDILK